MAFIMLGTGAFLTLRFRFFQFTHLGKALKSPFSSKQDRGGSAFGALATALGASIGTANIAGTAGAIAIGGPGAVFWMWAAGVLGMATKLCETVLAMLYRDRSSSPPSGGAMRYMELGLRRIGRALGICFSIFGSLAALVGTAMVQSNTLADAGCSLAQSFGFSGWDLPLKAGIGIAAALLTGAVITGGYGRIGAFSERAVPFMAALYILAGGIAVYYNRERLPEAFSGIIRGAFGLRPVMGGAAGAGLAKALRVGVARGVYSNEAGVGSSTMAHACSPETDPVKQGLLGVFEVFVDTVVMCGVTALVILTSPSPKGSGMGLALSAFASVYGAKAASVFLCVSVLLFAFTSLVGWSFYGRRCAEHLSDRLGRAFVPAFLLLIPLGACAQVGLCWKLGELFNYLMALPNLIAVILLSGKAARELCLYKMFEKSPHMRYNKS